jgi:hypothetical protein
MNVYTHTQPGKLMVAVMSVMSVILVIIGLAIARPALFGVAVLAVAGWLFHSLTIQIADGELRWRFGPGLIHKQVSLKEIAAVETVRTSFVEGWGIHWGRFGWLYNVSGYDAVSIRLRSGKRFALGTDEPEILSRKLREELKAFG